MPLRDTLNALHEKQQLEEQIKLDKPRQIKEWQLAIEELLNKIQGDLAQYEATGLLKFSPDTKVLSEENLGSYEVKNMKIVAGPATILIEPVALEIIGAWGRVDMHRLGRAGDYQRVMFLRVRLNQPPDLPFEWHIVMPSEEGGMMSRVPQRRRTIPYSKDALEQAIDFLLR